MTALQLQQEQANRFIKEYGIWIALILIICAALLILWSCYLSSNGEDPDYEKMCYDKCIAEGTSLSDLINPHGVPEGFLQGGGWTYQESRNTLACACDDEQVFVIYLDE